MAADGTLTIKVVLNLSLWSSIKLRIAGMPAREKILCALVERIEGEKTK